MPSEKDTSVGHINLARYLCCTGLAHQSRSVAMPMLVLDFLNDLEINMGKVNSWDVFKLCYWNHYHVIIFKFIL